MANSKTVSETVTDYGMAKTDLQAPLVVEREGQPLAVLIAFEEYRQLQSIATREKRRQQMAWRELDEFLGRIHSRPTSYTSAQIEAEITVARGEVREQRRGRRRSR